MWNIIQSIVWFVFLGIIFLLKRELNCMVRLCKHQEGELERIEKKRVEACDALRRSQLKLKKLEKERV